MATTTRMEKENVVGMVAVVVMNSLRRILLA